MRKKLTVFLVLAILQSLKVWAQDPKLVLPIGHTNTIKSTVFSTDGKFILTASTDKTVKLWESRAGKLLYSVEGDAAFGLSAGFSNDGKYILFVSAKVAKIWDAATAKLLNSIEMDGSQGRAPKFSSSGKYVVQPLGTAVKIWESISGKRLYFFEAHDQSINSVEFSSDEKYIVTISIDKTAKLWQLSTGKLLQSFIGHTQPIISANFSFDGNHIVTSSIDKKVNVWATSTGTLILTLQGDSSLNQSVRFSSNGKYILYASGRVAKIWEVETGKLLHFLESGSRYGVNSAFFSPEGKYIVTASVDGVKIWESATGKLLHLLDAHTNNLNASSFSNNGKYLASTNKIWEISSGKLLHLLQGHTWPVVSAKFNPNGKHIVLAYYEAEKLMEVLSGNLLSSLKFPNLFYWDFSSQGTYIGGTSQSLVDGAYSNTVKVWETRNNKPLYSLKGMGINFKFGSFSDDEKYFSTSADNGIKIWDCGTGKIVRELKDDAVSILHVSFNLDRGNAVKFSPNGKLIAAVVFTPRIDAENYTTLKLWEISTGRLFQVNEQEIKNLSSFYFSQNGKYFVSLYHWRFSNAAKVWETSTGKLLYSLNASNEHQKRVISANFSIDEKFIATSSIDGTVRIYETSTGRLVQSFPVNARNYKSVSFSPDGKYILSPSGNSAGIWNTLDGKPRYSLKGHTEDINSASFSPDGKHILTASYDSKCMLWNAQTGKEIYTWIAVDSADYLIQIPTGYYQCTQNVARLLHYVTNDLKVITFEQLDVKYNRPDKVLEAIGNTDTSLIDAYRKAYQKRISKLGIDTTAFSDGYSVPEADFANREDIHYDQTTETLTLQIKGFDNTFKLDRFNVWVNEVPVFGSKGISIRYRNDNKLDTTITIILSQGENRIETSITNVNGTESYHRPLFVRFAPTISRKAKMYFIGIGIDSFIQERYNLSWSVKDIRDIVRQLTARYKNNIVIDTLFNEDVTRSSILSLKKKLQQTTENDKVVIAYSGHGIVNKNYDYILSTYNIDFNNPEQNGILYDELEDLVDGIRSRKKLMLIDACHSGELDRDEFARIKLMKPDLEKNNIVARSIFDDGDTTLVINKTLGIPNSFQLMQELFLNIDKRTGTTVISAASGAQLAYERGDLKNGVFTYCVLDAIEQNPLLTVLQLKKIVIEKVSALTNGLQKPTCRTETLVNDWSLWQ